MKTDIPTTNNKTRILVVDDDADIRRIISEITRDSGYETYCAETVTEALHLLSIHNIDVLITDINLENSNGIELAKQVRHSYNTDMIVMTGDRTNYSYDDIVAAGANDFMLKPFSLIELKGRLHRVLQERNLIAERLRMHEKLKDAYKKSKTYARELSDALRDLKAAHTELEASNLDTINRLALAAEYKDELTGDHIVRMSEFCALLAEKSGISPEYVQLIRHAAPMHDVGKIGVPDYILLKPGKLSAEEFDIMKSHTTIGAEILAGSKSKILQMAYDIALNHHEKWDGTGYPRQLRGEEIPLVGRIVAIADVFDALSSRRPYKDPYPIELTLDIIQKERERQFDPQLTDLFMENIDEILTIKSCHTIADTDAQNKFRLSERDIAMRLAAVAEPADDCVC